jgi:hypothetical protein
MTVLIFTRIAILFLLFMVTLSINLDDNLIARLGFSNNLGLILSGAIACTLCVNDRTPIIMAMVIILSLNANMPADFSLNFGYDRDLYGGFMLALVIQPLLIWAFELRP